MSAAEALRQQLHRAQDATAMLTAAVDQIREKVRLVAADETKFGALSTSERIAVGMVLDRADLIKEYGTMLAAIHRLGDEWLAAALFVQRNGWSEE